MSHSRLQLTDLKYVCVMYGREYPPKLHVSTWHSYLWTLHAHASSFLHLTCMCHLMWHSSECMLYDASTIILSSTCMFLSSTCMLYTCYLVVYACVHYFYDDIMISFILLLYPQHSIHESCNRSRLIYWYLPWTLQWKEDEPCMHLHELEWH